MGEFEAGKWIVGLSLYFFVFFLIVFTTVNALAETGVSTDISVSDPGFVTNNNIPFAQSGECKGRPFYFCSSVGFDNDTICNSYTGCYWGGNVFSDDSCKGVFEGACSNFNDAGNCTILGCTWTDFTGLGASSVDPDTSFDWSAVKDTIGFMTGFDANLGAPSWLQFIISFLFFWIEFFMLLWAIYMAIPFLH